MPHPPRIHVTIVSNNPETLDGLEAYLRRAGVVTKCARRIEDASDLVPLTHAAVVLFPDDFDPVAVLAFLTALREHRAHALPVLVTKHPRQFEALPPVKRGMLPLVVPKPAWGWTILDAVRAQLDATVRDAGLRQPVRKPT